MPPESMIATMVSLGGAGLLIWRLWHQNDALRAELSEAREKADNDADRLRGKIDELHHRFIREQEKRHSGEREFDAILWQISIAMSKFAEIFEQLKRM